jgi:hypothetical protein
MAPGSFRLGGEEPELAGAAAGQREVDASFTGLIDLVDKSAAGAFCQFPGDSGHDEAIERHASIPADTIIRITSRKPLD